jgi:hypothetical protein
MGHEIAILLAREFFGRSNKLIPKSSVSQALLPAVEASVPPSSPCPSAQCYARNAILRPPLSTSIIQLCRIS